MSYRKEGNNKLKNSSKVIDPDAEKVKSIELFGNVVAPAIRKALAK